MINISFRNGEVSDCGQYLLVSCQVDCQDNLLFYADLQALPNGITGKINLTQIVFKFESDYEYITNTGSKFVIRTNKNAPRYKLICIDLDNPEEKNWSTLIPEHETNILEWAICVDHDKLVVCYMEVLSHFYLLDIKISAFKVQSGRGKSNETITFVESPTCTFRN